LSRTNGLEPDGEKWRKMAKNAKNAKKSVLSVGDKSHIELTLIN
jgi:hypothetical protein